MNYEVKHVSYNPTPLGLFQSPLSFICERLEVDRWELVRVMPVSQFEAVAVFQRLKEEVEDDDGGTEGAYL